MDNSTIRAYCVSRIETLEHDLTDSITGRLGRIDELADIIKLIDGLNAQMELIRKSIFGTQADKET